MLGLWIVLLSYGRYILHTGGVCTYPAGLRGEWYSTSNGLLTFQDSTIHGFVSGVTLIGTRTYTCEFMGTGEKYISRANVQFFSTVTGMVYLCIRLVKLSDVKYLVTYESEVESTAFVRLVVILTGNSMAATESTICNLNSTYPTGNYDIIVNKDQVSTATVPCPSALHSTFDVVMMGDTLCSGSTMDGRTDTTRLSFTYSTCAADAMFSLSGEYLCMYSMTSGSYTYLNVLNNNNTTTEPTTYRFSCFVLEAQGRIVYLTQHPEICQPGQTPYNVTRTGRSLVFVDNDPRVDMSGQIAVAVIVGLTVVLVLTFGILSFIKWYIHGRKKRINPTQDTESNSTGARRNWDIIRRNFIEKSGPFDSIPKIIYMRKQRQKRKASKIDSFLIELEVHEEMSEESYVFSDIEMTIPTRSAIRRQQSMDRKKMVQWVDHANTSVTAFRETPKWQKDWESYHDPLNIHTMTRTGTPSTAAYSVRTISSMATLGEITWYEPDREEHGWMDSLWLKIYKLLPLLDKKKENDYFDS